MIINQRHMSNSTELTRFTSGGQIGRTYVLNLQARTITKINQLITSVVRVGWETINERGNVTGSSWIKKAVDRWRWGQLSEKSLQILWRWGLIVLIKPIIASICSGIVLVTDQALRLDCRIFRVDRRAIRVKVSATPLVTPLATTDLWKDWSKEELAN